jgi:hypothetical protein
MQLLPAASVAALQQERARQPVDRHHNLGIGKPSGHRRAEQVVPARLLGSKPSVQIRTEAEVLAAFARWFARNVRLDPGVGEFTCTE